MLHLAMIHVTLKTRMASSKQNNPFEEGFDNASICTNMVWAMQFEAA